MAKIFHIKKITNEYVFVLVLAMAMAVCEFDSGLAQSPGGCKATAIPWNLCDHVF